MVCLWGKEEVSKRDIYVPPEKVSSRDSLSPQAHQNLMFFIHYFYMFVNTHKVFIADDRKSGLRKNYMENEKLSPREDWELGLAMLALVGIFILAVAL